MAPLDDPTQAASSSRRQFTLVSSDGQSFPVDAIQLVAASTVFADMIHLGQPSDQPATCTLSEDKVDVALFVQTIMTTKTPVDETEWLTLFKMADKYDCKGFETALKVTAWQATHTNPIFAYAAGVHLKDRELAGTAAYKSLMLDVTSLSPVVHPVYFTLPQGPRVSLEHYYLMHLHVARSSLEDVAPDTSCICYDESLPDPPNYNDSAYPCWKRACIPVLGALSPADNVPLRMAAEFCDF
ncbi:hypothetical protein JCM10449v2_005296 [Rhodotorula kratochvilovae]